MPEYCKLSRSRILRDAFAITRAPLLDFLVPAAHTTSSKTPTSRHRSLHSRRHHDNYEYAFFDALQKASLCRVHRRMVTNNSVTTTASRTFSAAATRRAAESLRHERYDSKGRLIIETTPPRQPAFLYDDDQPHGFFDKNEQQFAASSRLPSSFFTDINSIRHIIPPKQKKDVETSRSRTYKPDQPVPPNIDDQLRLLNSVRELEEKLAKAKHDLAKSMTLSPATKETQPKMRVLTKNDYLNLVDLYFYSHNSRFSPESSDLSPTPIILNDYSFTLSADFTRPDEPYVEEEEDSYVSPLKEIEQQLKTNQLKEIAVMQVFIDLLLDDRSSNRVLYEAYKQLPRPGVAYLPKGVIRLFLQRMSTPWVKTQASMLRYLSLIDDMQQAKLPITVAEWSSAIHLAGRSLNRIDLGEVNTAFNIWRQMEEDAGVKSSNVTFNILFDVAVRHGKFALGETVLTEMHKRNLRLNRMGRVSLMYYHGLRGDGDGVRKAYHDFVQAGEIVDTLVLNCVIASLVNAQEPTAAEQVYQRMKDMQATLRKGQTEDGSEALFKLHPDPGSNRIGDEMASNYLGRVLSRAPNLRENFPDHHQDLQSLQPLTPDFTTFRVMLAYHASVSGDLDRMTVLLKDMLENFDIPLFPVVFQLLFKGFAIHRPKDGQSSTWSKERLDMVWDACRTAIRDSSLLDHGSQLDQLPFLPSITDVNDSVSSMDEITSQVEDKARKLSLWHELVIDLAAFPRERLKRIQRYSSTQFDEGLPIGNFQSPFFQNTHYSAPQPELDDEEGEYTLPDPVKSKLVDPSYNEADPNSDEEAGIYAPMNSTENIPDEDWDEPPTSPREGLSHSAFSSLPSTSGDDDPRSKYRLYATKPLVCWLLRAYSRVTGSRPLVEEIWGSIRKIWTPKNDIEAQIVLKVLLRCLQDCDRMNGRG